jgi:hypothetical protein
LARQMGRIPRCGELRNKAGLDLTTLAARLGSEGPKERSLRRLESGYPIRLAGAYRVVHAINDQFRERGLETVDPDKEVAVDKD